MIRYAHTNLIANDWRSLSAFYEAVFDCVPIPPERDLSGKWISDITGVENAHIRGIHLRLPGFAENAHAPTLEIFEYSEMLERPEIHANTPGFSHIAFTVDDVKAYADKVVAAGGSIIGTLTQKTYENIGDLTAQYVADPEGNIIELLSWTNGHA